MCIAPFPEVEDCEGERDGRDQRVELPGIEGQRVSRGREHEQ